MFDRITNSRHFATAAGFFFAAIGFYLAVCLMVGVSITIILIGKAVTAWF